MISILMRVDIKQSPAVNGGAYYQPKIQEAFIRCFFYIIDAR